MENNIALMFMHWFSDFCMQDDETAIAKSSNILFLLWHCFVYTFFFLLFLNYYKLPFFIILFISHFFIDFVSSKLNAYLWKKEMRHYFFVSIGFDQFLHIATILYLAEKFTK